MPTLNPPKQDLWSMFRSLNQAIFGQAEELLGFRLDFLFLYYKGLHHELGNSWSSLGWEACPNTIVFGSAQTRAVPFLWWLLLLGISGIHQPHVNAHWLFHAPNTHQGPSFRCVAHEPWLIHSVPCLSHARGPCQDFWVINPLIYASQARKGYSSWFMSQ